MKRLFDHKNKPRIKDSSNNNIIAQAIRADKHKRDEPQRRKTMTVLPIKPDAFTKFMGIYHNQKVVEMEHFEVPQPKTADIENIIKRSKRNNVPCRDSVHNEMLKAEPTLVA